LKVYSQISNSAPGTLRAAGAKENFRLADDADTVVRNTVKKKEGPSCRWDFSAQPSNRAEVPRLAREHRNLGGMSP